MPHAFSPSLYEIRSFINTAYATLSTNTETAFISGSVTAFRDLIFISAVSNSSAIRIDLRDGTGSGVVATVNADGSPTMVRLKQNVKNNTWTIKYNNIDVSGTTTYVNAVFIEEN